MITMTDLTSEFGRNVDIIKAQTQGLTHADTLLQLPFRGNCMNWVLGHMADSRNNLLQFLQHKPILNEAELKRYGNGSEPVCGDGDDIAAKVEEVMIRVMDGRVLQLGAGEVSAGAPA